MDFTFGLFDSQPVNAYDKGREALKYFHNRSIRYGYTLTFDQLIDSFGAQKSTVLINMGNIISSMKLDGAKVQAAMETLADKQQGKLPQYLSAYGNALNLAARDKLAELKAASAPNAVTSVILDVANDVNKVTTDVAKTVGGTFEAVKWVIIPAVILGAVFVIYGRSRQLAGR